MSEAPLVAQGLCRHFARPDGQGHQRVLEGVDLRLKPSEAVAIIGPSGSGKTTLLNLISGLDTPDAGSVRLGEQLLSELDDNGRADLRSQGLGLVFQRDHLLPQCTALENILVPTLARPKGPERLERAQELLEAVGLAHLSAHLPHQLSAGQRQRVAVARALIHSPPLLLADEPTGALDRAGSEALVELLLGVREREGTALLVATHDAALVEAMDRVLMLNEGTLVAR